MASLSRARSIDPRRSPLRQRIIENMTVRQFREKAPRDIAALGRRFARLLSRSHDQASPENLRQYRLHLA
jgi:hypothetical protein